MKLLFVLLMLIGSLSAKSNPGDEPVSPVVLHSFNQSFAHAEDVNWSVTREFYKAEFLLNCQYVFAFYSKDGSLIAATRNILFTELPVILQTNLKELKNGYWISDLFELSNENGTTYYLTLENADQKVVYQSSKTEWNFYHKKIKT
jgi:hypothetical protein